MISDPRQKPLQVSVEAPKTGYMASLDGWRAVAILGVMMTHDGPWTIAGHNLRTYQGYGGYGVYLFFAISGFLITTRILEEEKLCGVFNIGRFYIRRLFRIQPAALAYLAVVAGLMLIGLGSRDGYVETWHSWFAALLLFTNFTFHVADAPRLTGHFWTLAVEEHFYILLSLSLLLFKRHRAWVLGGLYALALAAYLSMGAIEQVMCRFRWYPCAAPRSTQWQLMSLFLAAFVAALLQRERLAHFAKRWLQPWVAFVATPLLMAAHNGLEHLEHHGAFAPLQGVIYQFGFMAYFLPALWLVATVYHPASWTTRVLEMRVLRFIGRISYSLYLWHVMVNYLWFLVLFNDGGPMSYVHSDWLRSLLERPLRFATTFAVATASYYWLEKPLIRMGHKLAPPATPGRPELADLPVEKRRVPQQ
jgi:peptidoglycan/LPS O-acetylase OafA/YrhL